MLKSITRAINSIQMEKPKNYPTCDLEEPFAAFFIFILFVGKTKIIIYLCIVNILQLLIFLFCIYK